MGSALETVSKDLKVVVCSEKASPQGTTQMVPRPRDFRAISLELERSAVVVSVQPLRDRGPS